MRSHADPNVLAVDAQLKDSDTAVWCQRMVTQRNISLRHLSHPHCVDSANEPTIQSSLDDSWNSPRTSCACSYLHLRRPLGLGVEAQPSNTTLCVLGSFIPPAWRCLLGYRPPWTFALGGACAARIGISDGRQSLYSTDLRGWRPMRRARRYCGIH